MNTAELYETIMNIADREGVDTPITLDLSLEKLKNRLDPDGNQKRYFKVYIGSTDITYYAAEIAGLPFSKAKDTYGTVLIKGCGMDMGLALTRKIQGGAVNDGFENLFESSYGDCKSNLSNKQKAIFER